MVKKVRVSAMLLAVAFEAVAFAIGEALRQANVGAVVITKTCALELFAVGLAVPRIHLPGPHLYTRK